MPLLRLRCRCAGPRATCEDCGSRARGDGGRDDACRGSSSKGEWTLIHRDVEIVNVLGLHLRAADKFVRLAHRYRSDIHVTSDGTRVDGKSILDLITLAAPCGSWLNIEASGPDAEAALVALSD